MATTAAALLSAGPQFAQFDCTGVSAVDTQTVVGQLVVEGVPGEPLQVTAPPGDTGRLFIVSQSGEIRVWKRGEPSTAHSLFLDLSGLVQIGGEQGLLALAFDPDYSNNGFLYVNYIEQGSIDTVVSRFRAVDSPSYAEADSADAASETVLLRIDQPSSNHNGGMLAFGKDGYLYISSGDGGGGGDPWGECGNGQNDAELHGTILRIDPSAGTGGTSPDCGFGPYTNPPNAGADGSGGRCDEIWAHGLRNPWRMDVDPLNGDLYIGDVGQRCWEEVNWVPAGDGGFNFGWRSMEGSRCFDPAVFGECEPAGVSCGLNPDCNDPSLTLPVAEYGHVDNNCSVTGGMVYRGCRMPGIDGRYFYGDFCAGSVLSFVMDDGVAASRRVHTADVDPNAWLRNDLAGFGRDGQGEIYAVDQTGRVIKFVPPFPAIEVSGLGAPPLRLDKGGPWDWEEVPFTAMRPVDFYRVYRGAVDGPFSCIESVPTSSWSGDTAEPLPGQLFGYLVTAVDADGQESSPGAGRTVLDPCPAP